MKLSNMKISKAEAKAEMGPISTNDSLASAPRYPYGLELRLDNAILEKLGITLEGYPVGAECVIEARGVVTEKSERETRGGKERKSLEIQITDLGIETDKKTKKKKAAGEHLNKIGATTGDDYEEE